MRARRTIMAGIAALALAVPLAQVTSQPAIAAGTTYYVDNGAGCSNTGTGTSTSAPWCDFTNVNGTTFAAGDQILLKSGVVFGQGLAPLGSGAAGDPIRIGCYGAGCAVTPPTLDLNSTTLDAVHLQNPSYWTVSDLAIRDARNGIRSTFTSLNHDGLEFANLRLEDLAGTGILLDGLNQHPMYPVPAGQHIIAGLTISNVAIADAAGAIELLAGYEGQQQYGPNGANNQQHIFMRNLDIRNISGCAINIPNASHVLVMDVYQNAVGTGPACGAGNYQVLQDDVTWVNGVYVNKPWTHTFDNAMFNLDNHMTDVRFRGNYFREAAGSALEWTENPCFSTCTTTTNTDQEISSNAFSTNSTYNCGTCAVQGYYGDIDAKYAPFTTGTIARNLYYDVPQTYNTFVRGGSQFVQTDNRAVGADADLVNAGYAFGGTQGGGGWSYEHWNGSTWSPLSYSASTGSWTSGTGASVTRFNMTPAATANSLVARVWTAPKAGSISIRGWVLKNTTGGDGAVVTVRNGATTLLPATTVGATDRVGSETTVDTTVAAGDRIYFAVGNGGAGDATGDTISWNPSIGYTGAPVNLALGKTAFSSSTYNATQTAAKAFDGDIWTNWQSANGTFAGQSLGVDLGAAVTFSKVVLAEYGNRTTGFSIQYFDGSTWQVAYTGTTIGASQQRRAFTFPAVTGSQVRVVFSSGTGGQPIIYEFEVYA